MNEIDINELQATVDEAIRRGQEMMQERQKVESGELKVESDTACE